MFRVLCASPKLHMRPQRQKLILKEKKFDVILNAPFQAALQAKEGYSLVSMRLTLTKDSGLSDSSHPLPMRQIRRVGSVVRTVLEQTGYLIPALKVRKEQQNFSV